MASNKDKLLASAQKSIIKGQTTRAIKDYQEIVKLDPKDMRCRQKLADLCSKAGRSSDAFESYEVVAKNFADKGFYLKAIAVYKQMQRLDSSQVSIYQKVAELNEKQGLVANAVAEYRTLVKHYEQNEMLPEAIGVLLKMKGLDPDNLNIRIKIAELYAATDDKAEGLKEFEDVLAHLRENENFSKIIKLYEVFMPLFPGDVKVGAVFSEACLKTGQIEQGLKILKGALKENPNDVEILLLLSDAYHQQKDYNNEKLTLNYLLKKAEDNLDYRLKYICACFSLGEKKRVLNELEEWKEAFFEAKRVSELKQLYERLFKYLPEEEKVLRTLRSIYEVLGDGDNLFKIMAQLPGGDDETPLDTLVTESVDIIDDSIMGDSDDDFEEIEIDDADVIEELEEIDTLELESVEELEELTEIEELDELAEIEEFEELTEIEEFEELAEIEEFEELAEIDELEELDDVEELEALDEIDDSLDQELVEIELEIELDIDEPDEAVLEVCEEDIQESAEDGEIVVALEEVEFYLQQGLVADAERICLQLRDQSPGHEKVQAKLVEIEEKKIEAAATPQAEYVDLAAEVMAVTEEDEEEDFFSLADDSPDDLDAEDVEVSAEDAESYYNLGIAYKEMGLLKDAIAEFDKAMKNSNRLVDSLGLKAMCLAQTGDLDGAEQVFWAVLEQPEIGKDERIGLQYELGLFYENSNRINDALSVFEEVSLTDQSYRDVATKMATLKPVDASNDEPVSSKKDRVSYI